jgi:hypothetical protein
MLGFIIGAVAAIGVGKLLRRRHGWLGGFGASHCAHEYGYGYGGMRHPGRHWMLRPLFERLETMPGQERAIIEALEKIRENRTLVRDEIRETRQDLARAVEGGIIDDSTLDETFARHDRLLAQLRVSCVESLKAVTETLNERQRKELARWIGAGGFFGRPSRWGGPERMWA